MTHATLLRYWRVAPYREVMSKAPKSPVSLLSAAISTEVKVLMAREDMDVKTLAQASGVKPGRLGYLLRRERSWNVVEINDVAAVFDRSASDLVALAEAAMPDVTPAVQDDYGRAADDGYLDGEDGDDGF